MQFIMSIYVWLVNAPVSAKMSAKPITRDSNSSMFATPKHLSDDLGYHMCHDIISKCDWCGPRVLRMSECERFARTLEYSLRLCTLFTLLALCRVQVLIIFAKSVRFDLRTLFSNAIYAVTWLKPDECLKSMMTPRHGNVFCGTGTYNHRATPRKWQCITVTSQWEREHLKCPASRLFIQLFIQTQIKESIKAPRYWPLCVEFTQMASNAENVSIWWRHHGCNKFVSPLFLTWTICWTNELLGILTIMWRRYNVINESNIKMLRAILM